MNGQNLRMYAFIQAILVRVEGMKAENARRALNNEEPTWNQEAFDCEAHQIENLAKEIS